MKARFVVLANGILTTPTFDTSGATSVTVDFWWRLGRTALGLGLALCLWRRLGQLGLGMARCLWHRACSLWRVLAAVPRRGAAARR